MKGFIILLFITIWCCTVLGKSDIAKRGYNIILSKENRIDETDVHEAKKMARAVNKAKNSKHKSNVGSKIWGKKYHPDDLHNYKEYLFDSVLNGLKARRHWRESSSRSVSRSSSRELANSKEVWKHLMMKRKEQLKNSTKAGGDMTNMVAARPWAVPCGDPAQHDMPWGTCVLTSECEAEFRLYKGDFFCGRTQFICCALAFTSYDMYQGFDASLGDTSLQTDSAELRLKKKQSSEKSRLYRQQQERRELREKRKKRLRITIRKIRLEVEKKLDRLYKNASRERRKRTKLMKQFLKYLKRVYKRDRVVAQEIHEYNLYVVDNDLYQKLLEIQELNKDFMTNDTFRQILLNKVMTVQSARMLVATYPQLKELVDRDLTRRVEGAATPIPATEPTQPSTKVARRRWKVARRRGKDARRGGYVARRRPRSRKYLDYDVEYGLLYS